MKFSKTLLATILGAMLPCLSFGFSFLGPLKPWHVPQNGYPLPGEIGGVVTPAEGFRWNVPVLYYAFDRTFIEYFGTNGIAAIEGGLKWFNDLPAASSMTANLTEFPLNTRQFNFAARGMSLLDLRSQAMATLMEELGFANPERFVWTVRRYTPLNNPFADVVVIKQNFDPVTMRPSSYVNGALYTYELFPIVVNGTLTAVAAEVKASDLRTRGYSSVAGAAYPGILQADVDPVTGELYDNSGDLKYGEYFIGLTRDDAGAIRRLYGKNNLANESTSGNLLRVVDGGGGSGGGAWTPGGGTGGTTNGVLTNLPPVLRPGIEKLRFQRVNYDSLVGNVFAPFNVTYDETYITNSQIRTRSVTRRVVQPDILFSAVDFVGLVLRTTAGSWINNAAINSHENIVGVTDTTLSLGADVGPGVITSDNTGPITIAFSSMAPLYRQLYPTQLHESTEVLAYGSFDGSGGEPIAYPIYQGLTASTLRALATSGTDQGEGSVSSPWTSTVIITIGTNTTTGGVTTP